MVTQLGTLLRTTVSPSLKKEIFSLCKRRCTQHDGNDAPPDKTQTQRYSHVSDKARTTQSTPENCGTCDTNRQPNGEYRRKVQCQRRFAERFSTCTQTRSMRSTWQSKRENRETSSPADVSHHDTATSQVFPCGAEINQWAVGV